MRLTEEQVRLIRKYNPNNKTRYSCGGESYSVDDLLDTIEEQKQEIKELTSRQNHCAIEVMQENETLRVQVQQLQAQNTAYQASVTRWRQGNYHNPADVEALRIAREVLEKSKTKFGQYRKVYGSIGAEAMTEVIDETLKAIEKAGRENV